MAERPGESEGSAWAAPDDPWAAPADPYAQPRFAPPPPFQAPVIYPPATGTPGPAPAPPAAPDPPPGAAPPPAPAAPPAAPPAGSPYVTPYAAPDPVFTPPAAPPPPWSYPEPVPPRLGHGSRPDPWSRRAWVTRPPLAVRLLAPLAAFMLPLAAVVACVAVEERAYQRYEDAEYVPVRGVVMPAGDNLRFVGWSPATGQMDVDLGASWASDNYDGERVTALVAPEDPTFYLMPSEQADPVGPLVASIFFATVGAAAAVAAVVVHRSRRVSVDAVATVAARAPDRSVHGPLTAPPPMQLPRLAGALVAVTLLGLAALSSANAAARAPIADRPGVDTVSGEVFNGSVQGRHALEVTFHDPRQPGINHRVLTPQELARNPKPGDRIDVPIRLGHPYFDDGDRARFGVAAALLALAAAVLGWRSVVWRLRLQKAAREPARAVDVVAWVRVVRGRNWLVVLPRDATHARQAVAVPLVGEREMPAAVGGTVYVHGRLKGGHAVALREPHGGVLWPSGPTRGAFLAETTLVPTTPPTAPVAYPGWHPQPWSYPAGA